MNIGTTADNKVSLMELHATGPIKIFDTAGIDEEGILGEKKRRKVFSTIKECDLAILVVNLISIMKEIDSYGDLNRYFASEDALKWEKIIIHKALKSDSIPVIIFNYPENTAELGKLKSLQELILTELDPYNRVDAESGILSSSSEANKISRFVEIAAKTAEVAHTVPCLPEKYLSSNAMVFLNIPMDAETPSMRLLRPQALVQEEAIRHFATTVAYRMDLVSARSPIKEVAEKEKARFMKALRPVLQHDGPSIIITDSQAVDIVHPWTFNKETGKGVIPFTTFSISMIQRQSRGNLPVFIEGIKAFNNLKPGDRVLVAEACNHNRITESCNDIGMVQIPNAIQEHVLKSPENKDKGILIEHAFGREFPELEDSMNGGLQRFKLAIHCGGCMIDAQKMVARISDLMEAKVPVTNYGLLLAYTHSPEAMQRALEPWGVEYE